MADIFGGFSGFANVAKIGMWLAYGVIFLIVMLILSFTIMLLIAKSKEKIIYELDLVTKKFTKFGGREKKSRNGKRYIYISKLKKFLPQIQSEDKYLKGKTEVILLIKDNNGLHHTARLPSMEELIKWFEVTKGLNLKEITETVEETKHDGSSEFKKNLVKRLKGLQVDDPRIIKLLGTVYLMPNPAEDLDWLAGQILEADRTFTEEWWKNPVVLTAATIAMCIFLVIITLIIQKKM